MGCFLQRILEKNNERPKVSQPARAGTNDNFNIFFFFLSPFLLEANSCLPFLPSSLCDGIFLSNFVVSSHGDTKKKEYQGNKEYPTEHFTISKPQNPETDEFYEVQKRQTTDFNAVWSGGVEVPNRRFSDFKAL